MIERVALKIYSYDDYQKCRNDQNIHYTPPQVEIFLTFTSFFCNEIFDFSKYCLCVNGDKPSVKKWPKGSKWLQKNKPFYCKPLKLQDYMASKLLIALI